MAGTEPIPKSPESPAEATELMDFIRERAFAVEQGDLLLVRAGLVNSSSILIPVEWVVIEARKDEEIGEGVIAWSIVFYNTRFSRYGHPLYGIKWFQNSTEGFVDYSGNESLENPNADKDVPALLADLRRLELGGEIKWMPAGYLRFLGLIPE